MTISHEKNSKVHVIAGAGITGLMCALKIKLNNPSQDVVIFDKSITIGGMYNSFRYDDIHVFDYGMHVIYESSNKEVDELYLEILPKSEWNIYEHNEKDIAGLYFNGRLQNYSHYVDLRYFPKSEINEYIASFMSNIGNEIAEGELGALDYLENNFGKTITLNIHKPIMENMYGTEMKYLDAFAIKATAFDRIILFNEVVTQYLMKLPNFKSRIGYPDQLNLPVKRDKIQNALYPKKMGMHNFIDALVSKLNKMGVKILASTTLSEIDYSSGKINAVILSNPNSKPLKIEVSQLTWTGGLHSLAHALNIDVSDVKFDRGVEMVFVNLSFKKKPDMGRLYYFYCYDRDFATFRVTNYGNYCPQVVLNGEYPICVELWPSKIGLSKNNLTKDECVKIAIDELIKFGVISADNLPVFTAVEDKVGEFPRPTKLNTTGFKKIRTRINKLAISNLTNTGVMAEDGLFFLPDILNHSFAELNKQ